MATKYAKQTFVTIPNKNTLQTVGGHAQAVYLWMCSMQNDQGECFPSYNYLAELTGFSRNTVIKAVKSLLAAGILRKTPRFNEGEKKTNLYEVMIVDDKPQTEVESYTQGSAGDALPSAGDALPSAGDALPSAGGGHRTKPTELNPLNYIRETGENFRSPKTYAGGAKAFPGSILNERPRAVFNVN